MSVPVPTPSVEQRNNKRFRIPKPEGVVEVVEGDGSDRTSHEDSLHDEFLELFYEIVSRLRKNVDANSLAA